MPIDLDSLNLEPKQSTTEFAQEREPLPYVQERTRSRLAKYLVRSFIYSVVGIFAIIVLDKVAYYVSCDKKILKSNRVQKISLP